MTKRKIIISTVVLSLSIVIGSAAGIVNNKIQNNKSIHSNLSIEANSNSLEEEFWNVDLIIQGTVLSQGQTFKKDSGIHTKGDSSFDVTPVTIQVNKVLHGDLKDNTITYLQHGSSKDRISSAKFVKKSEEVILILSKTQNGSYWSYNFDDGIWNVKDGKVTSKSSSDVLRIQNVEDNKQDLNSFIEKITKAAKNKRKSNE